MAPPGFGFEWAAAGNLMMITRLGALELPVISIFVYENIYEETFEITFYLRTDCISQMNRELRCFCMLSNCD